MWRCRYNILNDIHIHPQYIFNCLSPESQIKLGLDSSHIFFLKTFILDDTMVKSKFFPNTITAGLGDFRTNELILNTFDSFFKTALIWNSAAYKD